MNKFSFHLNIILGAIIVILILYIKGCTDCPEVTQPIATHTVLHDTITIRDTIWGKLPPSKITHPTHPLPHLTDSGCDSLLQEHNSIFTYQIPIDDSISQGSSVSFLVSQNNVYDIKKDMRYVTTGTIDTVTITVFRPVYKSTFTLGTFLSEKSSGVMLGYRSNRVHGAVGYDLNNKKPVVQLNYDLR